MRCRPWRWLWGLLPLVLLSIAALVSSRAFIEADLRERTSYALEDAGLDWASSTFVGRDAAMTGEAFAERDRARALDVVRNTWGVRDATDQAALAADISPYIWSAVRLSRRLRIEGYAPGDAERQQIGDEAERILADVSVSNRLKIGRGAPNKDRWMKAVTFALEQLALLENGEVGLSDLGLTIRGQALTSEQYKAIKSALRSRLPRGVRVVLDEVKPPDADPFRLSVAMRDGGLTVEGHAADEATIATVTEAARRSFPRARRTVQLEAASGAPERWVDAATIVLAELARLETGNVEIEDQSVSFSGEAETEATATAVTDAVRSGLPSSYRTTVDVTFRQADVVEIRPYTLTASYGEGALSIDGYAPDAAVVTAIEREASRRFAGVSPRVDLTVGPGAPEGWREAVVGVLGELSRLEEGSASLRDQTIDVSGVAKDQKTADAVQAAVETRRPRGFQSTATITVKAPEIVVIRPYALDVEYERGEVRLTGYAPSEAVREALRRFVERTFPGARIANRMNLGAGEPQGFQQAAETGIAQLGRLEEGRMSLRDLDVTIDGLAREQQLADSVTSQLERGMPRRFRVIPSIKVLEAALPEINPFTWSADYDGRTVRMEGYVHSESARTEVLNEDRRRLGNASVDDRMQLGRTRINEQIWLQRIDFALAQLGRLQSGRVELRGDGFSIRGLALDALAYRAATDALKAMPPGLRLALSDITPPVADVFSWRMDARGNQISMEGFVPSETARLSIAAETRQRFPGRTLEDRTELASGLDGRERDWLAAINLGLRAVAMVGDGRARLEGKRLTVEGTTDIADLPERIAEMVGASLPNGYDGTATIEYIGASDEDLARQQAEEEEARLAEAEQTKAEKARSYRWSATYDGLRLEFSGAVPGERERTRILNRAKSLLPGRSFDDRARQEDGAPQGWLDAVLAGLGQLAGLETGRLEIIGTRITLRGTTDNEARLARAEALMKSGLPRGFDGVNEITYVAPPEPSFEETTAADEKARKEAQVVKSVEKTIKTTTRKIAPEECEAVLNNRLRKGRLFFKRDSANLDVRDRKTLEPLAKVLERCADARIQIAGHTDSDGAAAYNQRLSEQRAQSVVDFLISIGVDAERLAAVGYGEEKPVASNRVASGKARNRRIEFEVRLR